MSLQLFLHPLSSYCHKVLIALYESDMAFEAKRIDDPAVAAEYEALSPLGRFPLLRDTSRGRVIPESTIIVEYLQTRFPDRVRLIPADPDAALQVRLRDRLCDNYLHTPMQKFAADRLRPEGKKDPFGLAEAKAMFIKALAHIDAEMAGRAWAVGDTFTLADCSAAPALFYGEHFYGPFRDTHPHAMAYLDRLKARPSYARTLEEAQPFMHLLPK